MRARQQSAVAAISEFKLKELSPTRNQLPEKTHEENSKNSKTQNPHILGVSMKGALTHVGKKIKKKSADSGSPESQLRRRRVRFGNWMIPLSQLKSQVKSVHKQQTTIRKPLKCAPEASCGGRESMEMAKGIH